MIEDWEPLVDALREELAEYGALLNLFDEQQEAILRRDPEAVTQLDHAVHAQLRQIREVRRHRRTAADACAAAAGQPADITLLGLVPFFPEPIQPMVQALVDEINRLVRHARRRAGQNQMLLARALEVSEELLQRLRPSTVTKTYSPRGKVHIASPVESRVLARG